MGECLLLFHSLRIGIHAAHPVTEQGSKTTNDVRPLRRTVVALACLVLTVKVAGPNRLLRIVVDTRKTDCALIASIGHELRHAIEVLQDRSVTSDAALFHFYAREGRHTTPDPLGAWETEAAVRAGMDVLAELRERRTADARPC